MASLLGYAAVTVAVYNSFLAVVHIRNRGETGKRVASLSYASSVCLFLAALFIVALYWMPSINGYCLCQGWFTAALDLYVLALFAMKFMYLERMKIFNKEPIFSSVSKTI